MSRWMSPRPATLRSRSQSVARLAPRLRRGLVTLASLAVVLVVWEIYGRQINPIFASYPSAIAVRFRESVVDGDLLPALWATLRPMLLGYLLAGIAGVILGLLIGRFALVEAALGIYITAGFATPLVALIPLFVLWFGLGFQVKVIVVFTLTVFPVVINTWAGVQAVPKSLIDVGHAFVAPERTILWKIIMPATIPYIMTGLRLGVGRAVIGIVLAEFFTALSGLGGLIIEAGGRFDTTGVFVPIIVLLILGVGLTALVRVLERRLAPWQSSLTGRDQS